MTRHSQKCEAPICQDDKSLDVIWYAGELVCKKKPYNKVQKKQVVINKLVKNNTFKHLDRAYSVRYLKVRSQ